MHFNLRQTLGTFKLSSILSRNVQSEEVWGVCVCVCVCVCVVGWECGCMWVNLWELGIRVKRNIENLESKKKCLKKVPKHFTYSQISNLKIHTPTRGYWGGICPLFHTLAKLDPQIGMPHPRQIGMRQHSTNWNASGHTAPNSCPHPNWNAMPHTLAKLECTPSPHAAQSKT
jgi:hypothetical protein